MKGYCCGCMSDHYSRIIRIMIIYAKAYASSAFVNVTVCNRSPSPNSLPFNTANEASINLLVHQIQCNIWYYSILSNHHQHDQ